MQLMVNLSFFVFAHDLFSHFHEGCFKKSSVTISNLVPQRHLSVLTFISVAQPQKFGNQKFDE